MQKKINMLYLIFLICLFLNFFECKNVEASAVILPLYGKFNQYFMYWTTIYVGNPGIKFTVVADTGSADLLIPQFGCATCYGGNPDYYYQYNASTTSQIISCDSGLKCKMCFSGNNQCGYTMRFGGGAGISEQTKVFSDMVNISSSNSERIIFGAAYNVSMGSIEDDRDKFAMEQLKEKKK